MIEDQRLKSHWQTGWCCVGYHQKWYILGLVTREHWMKYLPTRRESPHFYAPSPKDGEDNQTLITILLLGAAFGAIHYIAWNFNFPTSRERLAHFVCIIIAFPLYLSMIFLFLLWQYTGSRDPILDSSPKPTVDVWVMRSCWFHTLHRSPTFSFGGCFRLTYPYLIRFQFVS